MSVKRRAVLGCAAIAALLVALTFFDGGPSGEPPSAGETAPTVETDKRPSRQGPRNARKPKPVPQTADPATATPTEPAAEAPAELRVTVLASETGAPLAGALVTLDPTTGPRRELRTGADGLAVFSPPPAKDAELVAVARGRVRDFDWIDGREASESLEVNLELPLGERLVGRVSDPDGRPLEGVELELGEGGSLGGMLSSTAGPLLGATQSDAGGEFVFDGVPADEMVTLFVVHPGFAQFERTVRLAKGGGSDPVAVRLVPGGAVAGFVRGSGGRPVECARVLVAARDSTHLLDDPDGNVISMGASQSRALEARSDDQGRYVVHGLALGAPYVALATSAGAGRSERHTNLVAREGAETVSLDLRLRPLARLTVRVIDGAGERIAGATILLLTGAFRRIEEDEDGSYPISGLAPGEITLDVDADGYVKRRVTHSFAGRGDEELEVRLEQGLSISGVAVNDAGAVLANARIRAMRPLGTDLPDSLADTRTDSEGRFEVAGLLPGTHMVLCWADGHSRGKLEPVEAGARDVRVVSPRHAEVTLVLGLPRGASPPAQISIVKRNPTGGGSGLAIDWPEGGRLEQGVAAGGMTLVVRVDGYADLPFELDLQPGAEHDLGVVELSTGALLVGRVVDATGAPIQGAEITVTAAWSFDGKLGLTDDDGRFVIGLMARAEYSVEITAPGYMGQDSTLAVKSATEELDVTLLRGGVVHGRVTSANGAGVSDGTVWLVALDDALEDDFSHLDNAGRYGVRVSPGKYRVEYRPDGGEPIVGREVELEEGSRERIDFEVPR